jgi:hypothetical protein
MDYTDYIIEAKYKRLPREKQALVLAYLASLEARNTWPFVERRSMTPTYHMIGDRRGVRLEPPNPAHTTRVRLVALGRLV